MATELKLRPCPFCGSPAAMRLTFGQVVIGCSGSNRACDLRPDTWLTGLKTTDVAKVARVWNQRRADPDPTPKPEGEG